MKPTQFIDFLGPLTKKIFSPVEAVSQTYVIHSDLSEKEVLKKIDQLFVASRNNPLILPPAQNNGYYGGQINGTQFKLSHFALLGPGSPELSGIVKPDGNGTSIEFGASPSASRRLWMGYRVAMGFMFLVSLLVLLDGNFSLVEVGRAIALFVVPVSVTHWYAKFQNSRAERGIADQHEFLSKLLAD